MYPFIRCLSESFTAAKCVSMCHILNVESRNITTSSLDNLDVIKINMYNDYTTYTQSVYARELHIYFLIGGRRRQVF